MNNLIVNFKNMERINIFLVCLLAFALLISPFNTEAGITNDYKSKDLLKKVKIVFLITEDPDNYEAHKTIPVFAEMLKKKYHYDVRVLLGTGDRTSYKYPGIEAVNNADVLIVFARRIALPHKQIKILKNYIARGKPVIGIRTANHAFTVRDKIKEGYKDWPQFVTDILGCENKGYGPVETGTEVSVVTTASGHSILNSIDRKQWHSEGNIYLVSPLLDSNATVLVEGKANKNSQPIAWTRFAGKSKVFYTSLGYPSDFETPEFRQLLINAIEWSIR